MRACHFICASLLALSTVSSAIAQPPPRDAPLPGASTFTVFLRGTPIGNEQSVVNRTATGWLVVTTGRLGAPLDITTRRAEFRYTADWKPLEARIDGSVRGVVQTIYTVVSGTTASTEINAGGQATTKTDTIDPTAVLLPNLIFGSFEALTARLKTTPKDATIPAYFLPSASVMLTVGDSAPEQIQTSGRLIAATRTRVTIANATPPLEMDLKSDEEGRLLRVSVPAQNLEIIRDDIWSVSAREVAISRPNDEQVRIPANGFTLAGTLSRPAEQTAPRLPAVVLTAGAGPMDRDALSYGIPILGQVADALSNAGFIVVRYDKRGVGQSGGRTETASLVDLAEDQRAAVRFLAERKDVDPRRIAVVGHDDGGLVSLIAAAKEKRIEAVGLLATAGQKGADVVLAQQQRLLNRSTLTDAEKQSRVALQKQINDAILAGKLDALPANVRRQVDNAEFVSMLTTDPAKLMADVRQPLLIIQGELDSQIDPANADRLESLARARKKPASVDVVKVPGINHLLVPATTGEVDEYARLTDRRVSAAVTDGIVNWLKKILK